MPTTRRHPPGRVIGGVPSVEELRALRARQRGVSVEELEQITAAGAKRALEERDKQRLAVAEQRLAASQKRISEMESGIAESNAKRAAAVVNDAVHLGRIGEGERAAWTRYFVARPELITVAFDRLHRPTPMLVDERFFSDDEIWHGDGPPPEETEWSSGPKGSHWRPHGDQPSLRKQGAGQWELSDAELERRAIRSRLNLGNREVI